MVKTIKIGKKDVEFKSTAGLPTFYRMVCKREIFSDVQKLSDPEWLANGELETLENLAYAMAMFADPAHIIPKGEWLDQFGAFDIVNVLPELIALWMDETDSTSESKKDERVTTRELNTPLFLLRCVQLGLSIADLDYLSIGIVLDMITENGNDDYDYPTWGTDEDIDKL